MNIPAGKLGPSSLNGTLTLPKPPPRDFSISGKGSSSGKIFIPSHLVNTKLVTIATETKF